MISCHYDENICPYCVVEYQHHWRWCSSELFFMLWLLNARATVFWTVRAHVVSSASWRTRYLLVKLNFVLCGQLCCVICCLMYRCTSTVWIIEGVGSAADRGHFRTVYVYLLFYLLLQIILGHNSWMCTFLCSCCCCVCTTGQIWISFTVDGMIMKTICITVILQWSYKCYHFPSFL